MAASKKKVGKDELRRFMREKQTLTKVATKRIDHPLAKYNSLNQLVCILCKTTLKNDLLWSAHIQSKQHKEMVVAVKTQGPTKPTELQSSSLKRKAEHSVQDTAKKKKDSSDPRNKSLPTDFFDDSSKRPNDVKERAKAALLAGYSSSSSDDEDDDAINQRLNNKDPNQKAQTPSGSNLPSDFFDNDTESTDNEEKKPKSMADILPEGFFDDPKLDAKVREVEYKDKMEEEWDLFQRAMKEEAHVSEVIIEEEDEQANLGRNIDEIDDQIERWREVENLHVKRETILKGLVDGQKKEESDDEVDDEELDEFLDWRAKKSLKE